MVKATISFSNSEKIIVHDGQFLFPITHSEKNGKLLPSMDKPIQLEVHIHDGLTPSIMEVLLNSDFFKTDNENDKYYSSTSISSIENIW